MGGVFWKVKCGDFIRQFSFLLLLSTTGAKAQSYSKRIRLTRYLGKSFPGTFRWIRPNGVGRGKELFLKPNGKREVGVQVFRFGMKLIRP